MAYPLSSLPTGFDREPPGTGNPMRFWSAGWAASIGIHILIVALIYILAARPEPMALSPAAITAEIVVLATPERREPAVSETRASPPAPAVEQPHSPEAMQATRAETDREIPPEAVSEKQVADAPPPPKRKPPVPARVTAGVAPPPRAPEAEAAPAETTAASAPRPAKITGPRNGAGPPDTAQKPATAPGLAGINGNAPPRYPTAARRKGLEGRVVLSVIVNPDGRVKTLSVRQSSGARILDRAARRAVEKWRFAPATLAGAPVAGKIEIPVNFKLQ